MCIIGKEEEEDRTALSAMELLHTERTFADV